MARPNKYNLLYFPLDVDFFDDHKVLMVEEEFGVKGGYLAIRLMAMVYDQGYYLDWEDRKEYTIAKRVGNSYTGPLVMEVLRSCLKHGLFNKELFEKHMVLTSNGIQKRWSQVMNQLRRKVEVNSELWLVSSEETKVSSEETTPPTAFSTQKEIKVNEIKEKKVLAQVPHEQKNSVPSSSLKTDQPPVKNAAPKFSPPTLDQVKAYFIEMMGNPKVQNSWMPDKCHNEASQLFDHYTANGWVQGRGKPIKDWQAACRNWCRNERKGTFAPPVKSFQPPAAAAIGQMIPKPVLSKLQNEINFLFGRFLEDRDKVTIISCEPSHYDQIKKAGLINFDDDLVKDIQRKAIDHLGNQDLEHSQENELKYMKKYGVIEFFKQYSRTGKEVVFDEN